MFTNSATNPFASLLNPGNLGASSFQSFQPNSFATASPVVQPAGEQGLSWDFVAGMADKFFGPSAGNLIRGARRIIDVRAEIQGVFQTAENAYSVASQATDKPVALVRKEVEEMLKSPEFWLNNKERLKNSLVLEIAKIYISENTAPSVLKSQEKPEPTAERSIKMTEEG